MRRLIVIGLLVLQAVPAWGYEITTHRELTALALGTAFRGFLLSDYLAQHLGLTGLGHKLGTKTVRDWILDGAQNEDAPLCRTARHFHNPLHAFPWDGAGLRAGFLDAVCAPGLPFPSSVRWAQTQNQAGAVGGGNWSWADARTSFGRGLTEAQPSVRAAELARAFEALGHQVHLFQDGTVPAHVRNDTHLRPVLPGRGLPGGLHLPRGLPGRDRGRRAVVADRDPGGHWDHVHLRPGTARRHLQLHRQRVAVRQLPPGISGNVSAMAGSVSAPCPPAAGAPPPPRTPAFPQPNLRSSQG